ncbi:glycoside hydrolase family 3 C-terminal domain-containing protein [Lederbergia sp. NSJ-179]|uniref:glycoside hydrolase family 3 N-terminal domain-containing protein n=1 Tax=Lederbergia sp. NSJ-179 TaxID=2931402 RepID=UPI001FD3178A|nr:glycoside hydrolase family 3 N-terminal domain-containing protein [Lederbergia sp. NSJ-179]MCJ7840611.1 glycoside hydrolase family 3 C-terminal domain-containing protein [Lederbergia sp. NSJ-179]
MRYKDRSLPIEERVEDLLSRMTVKEKVGQLNQKMYGWEAYRKTENGIELTETFKEQVAFGDGMGALYGLFRSDPWSAVTYENGIPTHENAKMANKIQQYIIENTRLGIPVLLSEECPHGHQALDGTLIPTNIGAGSTWNPELMEDVYRHVAAEVRSRGAHLGLISTLDILREPRWGRSEECYSEDPYLAAKMTTAAVKGLQGEATELARGDKIIAVLKHFCGQGEGQGGHNAGPANIGERELREIHLPGMKAGVKAGALGCMAAYNEIDGIPCHANAKLLTEILREEWGYEGIVMADGVAIDRLTALAGDYEAAAAMALTAGVDLSLWDTSFTTLEKAVEQGKVTEALIDRAVRRILRLKFSLGLFEQPYTDETQSTRVVGNESFRKTNLQVARESAVLLKNQDHLLPLSKKTKKIAVIGPNADQIYNQLGDYTAIQHDGKGSTVLQGIKEIAEGEVTYAKGCSVRGESTEGFPEAVAAAEKSDVVVLVLGGSSMRNFDLEFDSNGAAIVSGNPTDMDCGEGVDLSDLKLGGVQELLVKEIAATGKPIVTVLIQGRPHAITGIVDDCDAILCGWYPGQEGGQALAEIIFGKVNPSGKLAVSLPRSSMQLPVYYNQKDQGRELQYVDSPASPLFSFGYGLSYTQFEFSNLQIGPSDMTIKQLNEGASVEVHVDVKNTGEIAGAEVLQLYIKDMEASITRRVKELKAFQKIWLEPNEQKTVTLLLSKEELAIWNHEMEFVVEPGNIKIMVGNDSENTLEALLTLQ